jgi:hypothetical protein
MPKTNPNRPPTLPIIPPLAARPKLLIRPQFLHGGTSPLGKRSDASTGAVDASVCKRAGVVMRASGSVMFCSCEQGEKFNQAT